MRTYARAALISITLLIVSACTSTFQPTQPAAKPRTPGPFLEQSLAKRRAERVSDISYKLSFNLNEEGTPFFGTTDIKFQLKNANEPLTLDFVGAEIKSIVVNNKPVKAHYNGYFIELPTHALIEGKNTVHVHYRHPYSREGQGLHYFKDSQDGQVYLHTQFEPYAANKVFPCFDQPDLKASYQLSVLAPPSWQVISAMRESSVSNMGGKRLWQFPESSQFSTYLISLHAGPFKVWQGPDFRVPLRLYARESFAQHVDTKAWFDLTMKGFDFFEDYFDYPHPFSKYDQLVIPDFNSGAMENVGAVTFSERYMKRRAPTDRERESLAIVILHEMAHMWFGNLVTMEWWDDLWLNESFADYMAHFAAVSATEFTASFDRFFSLRKTRAYYQDQLETTHPIVTKVSSTAHARSNFDAITYSKGGSVLKQLRHVMGSADYQKGLRDYFQRYERGNTSVHNLIETMSAAAGNELSGWANAWLAQSGANELAANYVCDGDLITEFKIKQSPANNSGVYREHSLDVGLFYDKDNGHPATTTKADISGAETWIPGLIGSPCPDMVFPNLGDHSYALIQLDQRSLTYIEKNLSNIDGSLLHGMLWFSLWNTLLSGDIALSQYLEAVFAHLPAETSVPALRSQLNNLRIAFWMLEAMRRDKNLESVSSKAIARLNTMLTNQVRHTSGQPELDNLWLDAFISNASSQESLGVLLALLEGKLSVESVTLGQDRRWAIIRALSRNGYPKSKKLAEKEQLVDTSSRGKLSYWSAMATAPSFRAKRHWLRILEERKMDLSFVEFRTVARNLFPSVQTELHTNMSEDILSRLAGLGRYMGPRMQGTLTYSIAPRSCSVASVKQLRRLITRANELELSPEVVKALRNVAGLDTLCVGVKERMSNSLDKLASHSRASL